MGRIVGGILGAAVGGFLITKLKAERTQAAVTQLWVLLAAKKDPSTLTANEVPPSPPLHSVGRHTVTSCEIGSVKWQ